MNRVGASTHGIEDKHEQDDKVEWRRGSIPRGAGWCRKGSAPTTDEGRESRGKREEGREKRENRLDARSSVEGGTETLSVPPSTLGAK